MSFLRDTKLFKPNKRGSSSNNPQSSSLTSTITANNTSSSSLNTYSSSTSPPEPSPLAYTALYQPSRMLRPKDDFSTEKAVQLIQRYWMLQKQRKELSKQFHQRRNIIIEIVKTEETYVNDLKTIVEVFHKPIQKRDLLPQKQLNTVFQHIAMIYKLNETLLTKLQDVRTHQLELYEQQKKMIDRHAYGDSDSVSTEEKISHGSSKSPASVNTVGTATFLTIIKPDKNKKKKASKRLTFLGKDEHKDEKKVPAEKAKTIGTVFKETVPFMKLYTQYINNYDDVIATVRECRKENPALDKFLKECKKSKPECRGMDINSFLILPVQRIPRYQLLLRELIKNTPTSYEDYALLEASYNEIVKVANHLNSMKRKKEALMTTLTVQKRIMTLGEEYKNLMNSDGNNESTQATLEKLNLHKLSLVAPNRHYVDETKVEVRFARDKPDQQTSSDNKYIDKWMPYHAFLYNDLIIFVIEPGNGIDDEEETSVKTIEDNLRAPFLVQSLYFCFSELVEEQRLKKENILTISYYVGDVTYYLRFKDADAYSKIFMVLGNEINEEKEKLRNTFIDKNVEEEDNEDKRIQLAAEKMRDLRKTIRMKSNASEFLAQKKREFEMILKKLNEVGALYDKHYSNLRLARSKPEQDQITLQKEILALETEMDKLEPLLKECIARLKDGQEILENYVAQIQLCDKVLVTCLRDSKDSFYAIFGQAENYLAGVEFEAMHRQELRYSGKMAERNKSKLSGNMVPSTPSTESHRPATLSSADPVLNQQVMDQIFSLHEEKKALQDKITDLEKQLEQKKILFDNSIKERRRLAQDLEELSKKQNTKEPTDETMQQELFNKIVSLESSMVQLNTELETLQNENRDLKMTIETLRSEASIKHDESLRDQSSRIALLESNIHDLNITNSALKNVNVELKNSLEISQKSYAALSLEYNEVRTKMQTTVDELKVEASQAKNQMRRAQKKYKKITSDSLKGGLPKRPDAPSEEEVPLSKQLQQHHEYIKLERQVAELESKAKEQQDYKKKFEDLQVQLLKEQRKATQIEMDYEGKLKNIETEMTKLRKRNGDLELVSRGSGRDENNGSEDDPQMKRVERSHSVLQKVQIFQQQEPLTVPTSARRQSSPPIIPDTKESDLEAELVAQKKLIEALHRELDEQSARADKYEKLLRTISSLTSDSLNGI